MRREPSGGDGDGHERVRVPREAWDVWVGVKGAGVRVHAAAAKHGSI